MALRIAVITDIHYAAVGLEECTKRRRAIGDILLLRAVRRLNKFIRPDLTLLMGDLIDRGGGPDAAEELARLKEIIDLLDSPVIALPGNHDGSIDDFYAVFERPADTIDIGSARFVSFFDPEEPHYNSHRTDEDLRKMRAACQGFDGPLISLQHVPLIPPGRSACPYGLLNAEEALAVMDECGYAAAISGHYHAGDDLVSRGAKPFIIAPALCEEPFAFLEVEIDGASLRVKRHCLQMPKELELFDFHVHTQFAYCSQNMDIPKSVEVAREFGLAGLSLTEHSGQLYFDAPTYWGAKWLRDGMECATGRSNRAEDFFAQAMQYSPPASIGLEIDCDAHGRPVVRDEDFDRAQVRIGAVHPLENRSDPNEAAREVLARLEQFLGCGIDILAHPLREFARAKLDPPPEIVPKLVRLLRKHGVAAEINFHINEPTAEFVTQCLEAGVKLSLGSDSHNLYEIGEFAPHLELLEQCGVSAADLPGVLLDPARLQRR